MTSMIDIHGRNRQLIKVPIKAETAKRAKSIRFQDFIRTEILKFILCVCAPSKFGKGSNNHQRDTTAARHRVDLGEIML